MEFVSTASLISPIQLIPASIGFSTSAAFQGTVFGIAETLIPIIIGGTLGTESEFKLAPEPITKVSKNKIKGKN